MCLVWSSIIVKKYLCPLIEGTPIGSQISTWIILKAFKDHALLYEKGVCIVCQNDMYHKQF